MNESTRSTQHRITLYSYWRSSAAYRLRIALTLKGLKCETKSVNLQQKEHLSDAYRAINPSAKVPYMIHHWLDEEEQEQSCHIGQSMAMLEYLEERFPKPPLLPADPQGRARVREIAMMVASDIHPLNNLNVLQKLEQDYQIGKDDRLVWYHHWIRKGFTTIETLLSQDRPIGRFCHGDMPGMADILVIPQVYNAQRFRCPIDDFPQILEIAHECEQHAAFKAAHPDAQPDAVQDEQKD